MSVKQLIKEIRGSNLCAHDKVQLERYLKIITSSAAQLSPADLATARVMAGLSKKQAVKKIGITLPELEEIERGCPGSISNMAAILKKMDEVYCIARTGMKHCACSSGKQRK